MPSMTMCGLNISRSRSLQVPGSPSSELQTRYFGPGNWRGMKLHLRPVGKPAPPRPRSAEACAAAAARAGPLARGDALLGRHAGALALRGADAEHLAQRLVAAARLV